MPLELTTSQLSRLTEIPRRTIYRWFDDGFLPKFKLVEGRGPGLSDLHDKAIAVWAMFLDEASKNGVNFTGQGAGKVWLWREAERATDLEPGHKYDGPHLLSNCAHIVAYFRHNGFDMAGLILSGKLGFTDRPSRDRFCEIRIVPLDVAYNSVSQFVDPQKGGIPFLSGFEATHLVKSVLVINIQKLRNAFDYALQYRM